MVTYYATASTERVRDAMRANYLGQIITPAAGNRLEPWVEWIADNGIYSNAYPGDGAYLNWLASHADYRSRCRFAVAPDVVADHTATWERGWPMFAPMFCNSADGTYLAFGPDVNLPILLGWLNPGDFRFMRPGRPARRAEPVGGLFDLLDTPDGEYAAIEGVAA